MMSVPQFVAILLLTSADPGTPIPIAGLARPIDGDSLMIGSAEVRLHGIDAPESTQSCTRNGTAWPCGKAAEDQLTKLIAGRQVACTSLGRDTRGRTLGRCRAGETELNQAMVATGYALAYRRYSMNYTSAEDSAKLANRGIWSGTFELPSEVRHQGDDYVVEHSDEQSAGEALPVVVPSPRSKPQLSGGCRIKGNHSRKGEKIYHLPGMPHYAETVAEQIFCTQAQARAAGYRRSRADQYHGH